jgi:diacylglycerol kinase family enzyme
MTPLAESAGARRVVAIVALISGAALIVALPLFLFESLLPLAVSVIGLFLLGWGVLRGGISRGPGRTLWFGSALVGAAFVVMALLWVGQNTGFRLIVLAAVAAICAGATKYALIEPAAGPVTERRASPDRPILLMNPKSGGGKVEKFELEQVAQDAGIETVLLKAGDDLEQLARDAIARGANVLGMAGGDGSQALVASIAAEHDVPFVCIPAGTRNHFALDLGLDREDPRKAIEGFRGEERRIDYGLVNGRLFVNNVSLGLYARIVQEPGYREAKTKTAADLLPALLGEDSKPFDLRFDGPEGQRYEGAQLVLVSNNPYELTEGGDLVGRTRVDSGQLGVAAVAVYDAPSVRGLVEAVRALHLGQFDGLKQWSCPTLRIESDDDKVLAGIDGEALQLDPPLEFKIVPGGLRVLVPVGTQGPLPKARAFDPSTPRRLWQVARGTRRDGVQGADRRDDIVH